MRYSVKDLAVLYGILLGDGCLSLVNNTKKFIAITGGINDLDFFKNIVSPLLLKFRGKETKIKFRKDCRAIEFNFTDKGLFDLISSYGFPIGKKGPNITVPNHFLNKNLMKYIVQGFFATDGSIVLTKNPNKLYPRLELHTISTKLIEQTYEYLLSIGLNGHFYKCKRFCRDPRWKVVQDQYRFQFNGLKNLQLFDKLIGFINPKHKRRFVDFIKYSHDYGG